ncbi:5,10-methylenetetrahydrofolate reductase (NAD(P)) [Lachnospiraceae bacterium YSD2013]|nr:5,10-methylenetetrahydrofolate reductase (NAD(P)) [Lachnospiraceae bacterium YSD2013]
MNISNLYKSKKTVYSMEVFPPKKSGAVETVYNTLYGLRGLPIDYISVTYGAGGTDSQKDKTVEIASLIKSEYGIEPLSHLTCVGSTREQIAETLTHLKNAGVQNILALRGDMPAEGPCKMAFPHASDLAQFIREQDSFFNVAGACYPEGHVDAESLDADIENLKRKVDAGVTHLTTQLFFDNEVFYTFMDKVEKAGINVPIAAGIMPIIKKTQIERTVSMCGASIPAKFSRLISRYADSPEALKSAGLSYTIDQITDLVASGVRGIHLYTMNNVEVARAVTTATESLFESVNKI